MSKALKNFGHICRSIDISLFAELTSRGSKRLAQTVHRLALLAQDRLLGGGNRRHLRRLGGECGGQHGSVVRCLRGRRAGEGLACALRRDDGCGARCGCGIGCAGGMGHHRGEVRRIGVDLSILIDLWVRDGEGAEAGEDGEGAHYASGVGAYGSV